jgi:hypothetical protein
VILAFKKRTINSFFNRADLQENIYFALCMGLPLLFFSFAKNVIPSYSMFTFFPFAFIFARFVLNQKLNCKIQKQIIFSSVITVLFFIVVVIVLANGFIKKSEKDITAIAKHYAQKDQIIYYLSEPQYYSYFYLNDLLQFIDINTLNNLTSGSLIVSQDEDKTLSNRQKYSKIECLRDKCLYKVIS